MHTIQKAWNKQLSHMQIGIEYAFGMLKGRFPVLRELSGHDIVRMMTVVKTCIVLYNILLSLNDQPDRMDEYNDINEDLQDEEENNEAVNAPPIIDSWTEDLLHQTEIVCRNNLLQFFQDM